MPIKTYTSTRDEPTSKQSMQVKVALRVIPGLATTYLTASSSQTAGSCQHIPDSKFLPDGRFLPMLAKRQGAWPPGRHSAQCGGHCHWVCPHWDPVCHGHLSQDDEEPNAGVGGDTAVACGGSGLFLLSSGFSQIVMGQSPMSTTGVHAVGRLGRSGWVANLIQLQWAIESNAALMFGMRSA